MNRGLGIVLLVLLAIAAGPAVAATGNSIVRGGLSYAMPGGDTNFNISGEKGSLDVQESLGVYVGYEYLFTDFFGLDFNLAWQDHDYIANFADSAKVEGSVGNINLMIAPNFHVARCDWGTFYLGPVVSYGFAQDRASNALGLGAQVGTDIYLNDSGLLLNMSASYQWVSQDWDFSSGGVSYDVNPLTFRLGLGYKF